MIKSEDQLLPNASGTERIPASSELSKSIGRGRKASQANTSRKADLEQKSPAHSLLKTSSMSTSPVNIVTFHARINVVNEVKKESMKSGPKRENLQPLKLKVPHEKTVQEATDFSSKSRANLTPIQRERMSRRTKKRLQLSVQEDFHGLIQAFDAAMVEQKIEAAREALDQMIGFVEQTHYLTQDVKQHHIEELYKCSQNLEEFEAKLKQTSEEHRHMGNNIVRKIVTSLEEGMPEEAEQLIESAILAYQRARDTRWKVVAILRHKIQGDKLLSTARSKFLQANMSETLALVAQAHEHLKSFKTSKYFHQCQLLISLGLKDTAWTQEMYSRMEQAEKERYFQCSHPLTYYREQATKQAALSIQMAQQAYEENKLDLARSQLQLCKKYHAWLGTPVSALAVALDRKFYRTELHNTSVALKLEGCDHPENHEYNWVKHTHYLLSRAETLEDVEFMHKEGCIEALIQKSTANPKKVQFIDRVLVFFTRILDVGMSHNTLVQLETLKMLYTIVQQVQSLQLKTKAIELVLRLVDTKQLIHHVLKENEFVPILLQLRREHPMDGGLFILIATALKKFIINTSVIPFLESSGGLVCAVSMLRRMPLNRTLVVLCLQVLRLAVKHGTNVEKLIDNGVVPALVAAMQGHANQKPLQLEMVECIDALSWNERARSLLLREHITDLLLAASALFETTSFECRKIKQLAELIKSPRSFPTEEVGIMEPSSEPAASPPPHILSSTKQNFEALPKEIVENGSRLGDCVDPTMKKPQAISKAMQTTKEPRFSGKAFMVASQTTDVLPCSSPPKPKINNHLRRTMLKGREDPHIFSPTASISAPSPEATSKKKKSIMKKNEATSNGYAKEKGNNVSSNHKNKRSTTSPETTSGNESSASEIVRKGACCVATHRKLVRVRISTTKDIVQLCVFDLKTSEMEIIIRNVQEMKHQVPQLMHDLASTTSTAEGRESSWKSRLSQLVEAATSPSSIVLGDLVPPRGDPVVDGACND